MVVKLLCGVHERRLRQPTAADRSVLVAQGMKRACPAAVSEVRVVTQAEAVWQGVPGRPAELGVLAVEQVAVVA